MPSYDSSDDDFDQTHRRTFPHRSASLSPRAREDPSHVIEEVYVQRGAHDRHLLRARSAAYYDNIERQRGRSVGSNRGSPRHEDGRLDPYSPDSKSFSSRPLSRRQLIEAPRSHNSNGTSSKPSSSDNDTDLDYSSSDEIRKHKSLRKKELLYAGLATATTVAACNNIYQSRKAQKTRRLQIREGRLSPHEAKMLENQSTMLDLLSLGVAAIGVNNAMNGWKKHEAQKEERQLARAVHEEKRARRAEREGRWQGY